MQHVLPGFSKLNRITVCELNGPHEEPMSHFPTVSSPTASHTSHFSTDAADEGSTAFALHLSLFGLL